MNRREFFKLGGAGSVALVAGLDNPASADDKEAGHYETPVVYFTEPGSRNTGLVLDSVRRRSHQLNIKTVLVASVSGQTVRPQIATTVSPGLPINTHFRSVIEEQAPLPRSEMPAAPATRRLVATP